ncbi:hypothetical protein [Halococcus salifodinae]|uniref:Uncharacterized protein n=1 Tax=Halococcus salifodinae DSM 8989 TaxID=1227456 RepID=M0NCG7_9EURY|nr:hypothetical protein [Halococcus salifodinae]EMA54370.1 hypothetical protein C450_06055 [Halococcus salifodinae DSM 8989]
MSDLADSRVDEILEDETEAEQHGLYARLTRREDGRYAVEISPMLQSGGHEEQWHLVGGSVGYDASVFDAEADARDYFEDLISLSSEEMEAKYDDQGLWVSR